MSMKVLHFPVVGVANKMIVSRPYFSSSAIRLPLRSSVLDERYFHGIKTPISIKAKPFASMHLNEFNTSNPDYKDNGFKVTDDNSDKLMDDSIKSYLAQTQNNEEKDTNLNVSQEHVIEQKGHAKIHDFCFGIPYGGILFSGGLFGFIFTRNTLSLNTSMLGAAIVVLAATSLKVWRKGLSSLPFMMGQAALAATLLVKHFRTYTSTRNLFPSGLYIFMSVAMLCFYSYVILSGGNPPPKRKVAATPLS